MSEKFIFGWGLVSGTQKQSELALLKIIFFAFRY